VGSLGAAPLAASTLLYESRKLDDGAAVPAPTFTPDLNTATAFFKRSVLAGLIDMLRHEKPVSVTINNQPPGFVFVHTGVEPVGEGES
jgi:hypothetical protein